LGIKNVRNVRFFYILFVGEILTIKKVKF
jgi:hypothetical protein